MVGNVVGRDYRAITYRPLKRRTARIEVDAASDRILAGSACADAHDHLTLGLRAFGHLAAGLMRSGRHGRSAKGDPRRVVDWPGSRSKPAGLSASGTYVSDRSWPYSALTHPT
jgi:hypothetical protein